MALPRDEMGTGPAVLLLHAGVADRGMWSERLPWLAGSGFRAIAVDQHVAALAPERVCALALISAPARSGEPSAELLAAWEAGEQALARGYLEAAVQAVVAAWALPDAPPELRERVAGMQRRAFLAQAQQEPAPEAQDPLELPDLALGRLRAPVLIAVGERDMGDFHEAARALAAELPQAARAEIPGAGHLAPLEAPEAFRALLLPFLRAAAGPGISA